jgi:mono/diheme cytochrome c family protein
VHARRLLEGVGEGHVMTIVMREALAGARLSLRGELQAGRCPACESAAVSARHARTLLVDALRDPALARLYGEHGGVCLVHLLDALASADPPLAKMLAERHRRSLHDRAGIRLIDLLAGVDADGPRRAVWRERLPDVAVTGSTVEHLHERLRIDACPVCLATGIAERNYLRWWVTHAAQNDASLETDPGELCPAHLHDVALADPSVASTRAAQRKRATRIAQLERFLARLAQAPVSERRRRRNSPDALDDIRSELLAPPHCAACHARDGFERAQQDLVAASLGLAAVRARHERGHGLCGHHARRVPDGPAMRVTRQHADARLAVIGWEVQETARKYAWAFRHESSGPEHGGWLRGLAQINGRVFEGGPAAIGEHGDPEDRASDGEQR